jgi:predicted chitinase
MKIKKLNIMPSLKKHCMMMVIDSKQSQAILLTLQCEMSESLRQTLQQNLHNYSIRTIKRTFPSRTNSKKLELQMVSDYLQLVFISNGAWFTLKGNVTDKLSNTCATKNPHATPTILFHDCKVTVKHASAVQV